VTREDGAREPGKTVCFASKTRRVYWLSVVACLALGSLALLFAVLLSKPRNAYWRGQQLSLLVQPLSANGPFADERFFVRSSWSDPKGFSHGRLYGLKFGPRLLRLDIRYDPIADIKRSLPQSLPGLIRELDSKDSLVQRCVVEALVEMGPSAQPALPILMERCLRTNDLADWAVIDVSKAVGPRVVPLLCTALTNPRLQLKAIETLGEMGTNARAGIPELAGMLTNSNVTNVFYAVIALPQIERRDHGEVAALVRFLDYPDPIFQATAAVFLGEFGHDGSPAAVPLLRFMEHAEPQQAGWAARALGLMGPAGAIAVPRLVALLENLNPTNAWMIIDALGEFGEQSGEAIPRLCQIAATDNEEQRQFRNVAIKTLGKLGTNALPCLLELYGKPTPPCSTLCTALMTLGSKAGSAVPTLISELGANSLPYC
jgi:HEAT repeat protein